MRAAGRAVAALLLALGVAAPLRAEDALAGAWRGTYTCLQGLTALTLSIQESGQPEGSGPRLSARFEFFADPRNPTVPSGAFLMTGSYDAKSRALSLRQSRWITQPPNYEMIDLDGSLSADGTSLAGRVLHEGCSTFELTRARK